MYWYLTICIPAIESIALRIDCARVQLLIALLVASTKLKGEHLYIILVSIYYLISDMTWGGVTNTQLLIETPLLVGWAIYLHLRPEIETKTFSKDTVHLAFYKGEKASLAMRLAEIVDLPVLSVCLVYGDRALRIKDGVFTEVPSKSIVNSDNYVLIDTGCTPNEEFKRNIITIIGMKRKEGILRSSCLETIIPCLKALDERYVPLKWYEKLPSRYLRKILKLKRKDKLV